VAAKEIGIWASKQLHDAVREYADQHELSMSEVGRLALIGLVYGGKPE
jgi:hypothetical protein